VSQGTVKWFDRKKGHGFIVSPEAPTDIFVHYKAIAEEGFRVLEADEVVEFDIDQYQSRGLRAANVRRIKKGDRSK